MPDSGTPTDTPTIFTKWSWMDAVALSLLTCLFGFLFPNLANLQKQIFGRRVHRRVRWLASIVDPDMSVTICEYEGPSDMRRLSDMRRRSDAYEDVKAYLGAKCSSKARHLMGEGARKAPEGFDFSMRNGEEVADEIEGGATVWWSAFTKESRGVIEGEYRLYYQEHRRNDVLQTYLPRVRREGRAILVQERQRKIMTNTPGHGWMSQMEFNHPKTFKTLAMDPKKKQEIINDLDMFKNGSESYRKLGKPWKRGYLLYGPPGTGKSTMVAAMANYLEYDVYDIELMSVRTNTELRQLLIGTKSKSIIVIEDIDCSRNLTRPRKDGDENHNDAQEENTATSSHSEVTLSGLLNFIDGLWSACGEERIIVFTTNHVDKLDPALIRRGRMDMHIEMSYCDFESFKFLANLYLINLNVESHQLFGDIENLLLEVQMTPADVAEILTLKSNADNASDLCLQDLVRKLMETRRIADAPRAVPQGAPEEGPRRSPRIKKLSTRVHDTDGV